MELFGIALDWDSDITVADLQLALEDSTVEITVGDKPMFHAPLAALPQMAAYSGHYSQTSAADEQMIGKLGSMYMFRNHIVVLGGDRYAVKVVQGQALAVAQSIRIFLLADIADAGG